MPDNDYYQSLGVDKSASADEIKKGYRAQARKYHPDVNPGDKAAEAKFKEIQNAYDILSDPSKKKLYDQFGSAAFESGGMGPRAGAAEWAARQAGPTGGGQGGFENIDFSHLFGNAGSAGFHPGAEGTGSIFEELLGRVRGDKTSKRKAGPRAASRAPAAHVTIPFLTAVKGGETHLEITREDGAREALVVRIPAGLESGQKLRLRGQGEPQSPRGPRGDLTIVVNVDPHPYFTRDGRNLSVEVPVTIGEAVLGAKIDVPTLDGVKTLPVPAGSSTGTKLRLKGQGVPALNEVPAGDLFVILKVTVPKTVDEESRRLIEQFQVKNPSNPRNGLW